MVLSEVRMILLQSLLGSGKLAQTKEFSQEGVWICQSHFGGQESLNHTGDQTVLVGKMILA